MSARKLFTVPPLGAAQTCTEILCSLSAVGQGDQARAKLIGFIPINFWAINDDAHVRLLTALLLASLCFQVPVLCFKHRTAVFICKGLETRPVPGKFSFFSIQAPSASFWDEESWLHALHILSSTQRPMFLTDPCPLCSFKGCGTWGLNDFVCTDIALFYFFLLLALAVLQAFKWNKNAGRNSRCGLPEWKCSGF